jgi:hypothetical protein
MHFEPSSLMDYTRRNERRPQNLLSNPGGSNVVCLKTQHRSRAKAQELMVTGSEKKTPACCRSSAGRGHISDFTTFARGKDHASIVLSAAGSNRHQSVQDTREFRGDFGALPG